MTDGEVPQTPPAPPAREPGRRGWRAHPLGRRLPLLLILGLGLLWWVTRTPSREVVWQFDGYGWGDVRAIDFQVMNPEGQLVEREEHFFGKAGPIGELSMKWELPEGTYRTRLFVKVEGREVRLQLVDTLAVGDEEYIVRPLRLPANR